MRVIGGAIVILAGSVLVAAGVIGEAITVAANRPAASSAGPVTGMWLGLIGLGVFASGFRENRSHE
jgi:hypothetical protein